MLKKINTLSDTDFENLTHDLVVCLGMKNVSWRSPGSDGGRDIEADVVREDPTGEVFSESWFIECKRYSSSVSWPLVYEKVAYAESNNVDVLLIVTNAKLTPSCLNEVSKWNAQRRTLRITHIDGPRLKIRLESYPLLLAKYGLVSAPAHYPVSFKEVAEILATLCSAAEAEIALEAVDSVAADAAFEFSRMLATNIAKIENYGHFAKRNTRKISPPGWLMGMKKVDSQTVCFLAYIRYVIRAKTSLDVKRSKMNEYDWGVSLDSGDLPYFDDPRIAIVALWCGVQFKISGAELFFKEVE